MFGTYVAVCYALAVFAFFIFITIFAPDWWMRVAVRFVLYFRTPAERDRMCRASDVCALYYLGTTGNTEKDKVLRWSHRLYARMLGIAAILGVLFMIGFAIIHGQS